MLHSYQHTYVPLGRKLNEDTRLLVPASTPAPLLCRCTGVSVSMQMTMLTHKMTIVILSKTNPVFIPTVFVLVPSDLRRHIHITTNICTPHRIASVHLFDIIKWHSTLRLASRHRSAATQIANRPTAAPQTKCTQKKVQNRKNNAHTNNNNEIIKFFFLTT